MSDLHDDLILKSLNGTLTAEEQKTLEEWINASSENHQQVESFRAIWKATRAETSSLDFQTTDEWQRLKNHIERQADASVVKERPILSSLYFKIAASITLVAIASFAIYLSMQSSSITISGRSGAHTSVMLPDGSQVILNGTSELTYDKNNFNASERAIRFEGEAFFDIARNPEKPFRIDTRDVTVEVLGTSFNVRAIEQEINSTVYVVAGKVKVSNSEFRQEVSLLPGETGTFNQQTATLVKLGAEAENTNALSWRDKRLVFKGTPLHQVVESMEHYFDIRIGIEGDKLRDCRFTSNFDNPTLEEVVEALTVSLDLKFDRNDNGTYTVSGKGCL
jgi:transmembrane sensor